MTSRKVGHDGRALRTSVGEKMHVPLAHALCQRSLHREAFVALALHGDDILRPACRNLPYDRYENEHIKIRDAGVRKPEIQRID